MRHKCAEFCGYGPFLCHQDQEHPVGTYNTRLLLGWEAVGEAIRFRSFALQTICFFNTRKSRNICEGGRVAAAFVTLNLLKRHIAHISQLTPFREISVGVNQPAWIETHPRGLQCAARMRILPKRCLRPCPALVWVKHSFVLFPPIKTSGFWWNSHSSCTWTPPESRRDGWILVLLQKLHPSFPSLH